MRWDEGADDRPTWFCGRRNSHPRTAFAPSSPATHNPRSNGTGALQVSIARSCSQHAARRQPRHAVRTMREQLSSGRLALFADQAPPLSRKSPGAGHRTRAERWCPVGCESRRTPQADTYSDPTRFWYVALVSTGTGTLASGRTPPGGHVSIVAGHHLTSRAGCR